MYNSVLQMAVVFAATAIAYISIIEGNPLPVLRKILSEKTFAVYLVIMFGVIGIDVIELNLERVLKSSVTWDFTIPIFRLEGGLTEVLQKVFHNELLTHLTVFFYVFVFPVLVWVAMAVFNRHGNKNMLKKLLLVFVLNYVIALPFYLLFPVNEAWYSGTGVELLIRSVYPAFETQYRSLSGLNNCFPSLHTSLSISVALLSIHSGYKRLALVMSASSAVIVFSTLYLGIHWFADVTGGMVAAMVAVNFAIVWVDGTVPVIARLRQVLDILNKQGEM
ncbi:MAG: phosphatase PAP2 family protein [Eubacteriales bacterium]